MAEPGATPSYQLFAGFNTFFSSTWEKTRVEQLSLKVSARGLKKPKNGKFVCFLVRDPSVRFLETVPFDPRVLVEDKIGSSIYLLKL